MDQRSIPAVFNGEANSRRSGSSRRPFDLRSFSIPVTPGEVLALVLQNPLAGFPYYGWAGVSGDMYARGGLFSEASSLGRPTFGSEPFDLAFQTFVDTTPPVPEPATFHLIASGFAVARRKLFHP